MARSSKAGRRRVFRALLVCAIAAVLSPEGWETVTQIYFRVTGKEHVIVLPCAREDRPEIL